MAIDSSACTFVGRVCFSLVGSVVQAIAVVLGLLGVVSGGLGELSGLGVDEPDKACLPCAPYFGAVGDSGAGR